MKIFCTLFWTAIVAIAVERCRAEFLLAEIDDAAGDTKVLPPLPPKGKLCFSFL